LPCVKSFFNFRQNESKKYNPMKLNSNLKNRLNIIIAFIWIVNRLYCKLLHFLPRHDAIVTLILGEDEGPLERKEIGNHNTYIIIRTLGILYMYMAMCSISN
jgi:hypothetical protein